MSEKIVLQALGLYLESIRIPYDEIASATNNFADENIISHGTSTGVKLYKGLLSQSGQLYNIVARQYPVSKLALMNELLASYCSTHKNIATLFKTSMSNNEDIILISKYAANGSLDKYLSGSTLTWMQRLHICVGIAHALSYLLNDITEGNGNSFVHGNIKSSKILLDDNWEPKLSGFGYSERVKRGDFHRPSEYCNISAYTDPSYINTRSLSHKSDVFSFGVVLFEVLFGMEASTYTPPNEEEDHWYFARLARENHKKKTLDDMIDPDLRKQMDLQSLNVFSKTAVFCLKEVGSKRPDIDQVVSKLEKALKLQQKHNHSQEHSTTTAVERRVSSHLKGKNVDHLKIRLSDIQLATQNFSETCKIGSRGFGVVYKADLYHFDVASSSAIEAKNEGEFPKICSTVAIKRIFRREDLQGKQGFIAEIELLSNCKHPNVVSLLGYCDEGHEMILIYEYASNESLESYLENPDKLTNLTWGQRIQICLGIAQGLSYLHTSTEKKERIIHRDIKSANVLLDGNWVAKIADFGLSKLRDANQQGSTIVTINIAGTKLYLDPEYMRTGNLKRASDIYSFGVVLFEILFGKLAYDPVYYANNQSGLPSIVVREPFNIQKLKEMVDPKIMEADDNILALTVRANQESLETFIKIAYQCVAKSQAQRPKMEAIIKELEKSLDFQKNSMDILQMSLKEIKSATQNFSDNNCIKEGISWKLYKGEATRDDGCSTIIAKRWDRKSDPKYHHGFLTELEVLYKYKHNCIIGFIGYCNEMDEKIIVYQHGNYETLNNHLDNACLAWTKRLKISIEVTNRLSILHTGGIKSAKRWDRKYYPKYLEFLTELEVLFTYKDKCNMIGYCNETDVKIIVYQHGNYETLNNHLDNACLEWTKHLKISIEVAKRLSILHTGGIKSANVLLDGNWVAKIANFGLSKLRDANQLGSTIITNNIAGTKLYLDPEYMRTGNLKRASDIYSFGVVLFEILFGKLAYDPVYYANNQSGLPSDIYSFGVVLFEILFGKLAYDPVYYANNQSGLPSIVVRQPFNIQKLKEMVDPKIKEADDNILALTGRANQESLETIIKIAYQFVAKTQAQRPKMEAIIKEFEKSLDFQEGIDIWELKLPKDYKEIIKMSTTPDIYSTKTRKELYEIFHKGILLQEGKVWFSLNNNEERNETISARMFSYENHKSHKSRSIQNPRFQRVVRVLNSSNLEIQVKIKPQFLSQNVIYGAYLVFKLCDPRKFSNQPMYVNLKYKMGGETLHAYFATWRDDKWVMIELCRFLHDENHSEFEVQLESFSRYYCGSGAYIEGLEFRAISDASLKVQSKLYEKIQGQPVDNNERTKLEHVGKLFSESKVNLKKFHMLPAKMVLSDSSNAKCFVWKSLPEIRFKEVAEFLSNQVIRIKCKIETQALLSNTAYACYLIFTLAEECHGLQCPMKIRENKETKFLYFRTPSTMNLHNIQRVPQQREDGLMEVIVWEFNSNKLMTSDYFPMDLKLKCYEGTLRGLIVHGIQFRHI